MLQEEIGNFLDGDLGGLGAERATAQLTFDLDAKGVRFSLAWKLTPVPVAACIDVRPDFLPIKGRVQG
jgi:hypothetical protein